MRTGFPFLLTLREQCLFRIPFGSDDPSSPAILSAADLIRKEVERQLPTPVLQTGKSYSCFISYSNRDRPFAHRLHEDLDMVGVRSWLDAKDIAIGTSWKLEIGKAIQEHDKILLVLSEASISSTWVKREVDSALKKSTRRTPQSSSPSGLMSQYLNFPKDSVLSPLKDRQIADFRGWRDPVAYQKAFSKLARDLAISASVESTRAVLMRRNLTAYSNFQVFLNYPFDDAFAPLGDAMAFAVVAGGMLPVCAFDLSAPDRPRLEILVEAIRCCRYSAHDFSRSKGEGAANLVRSRSSRKSRLLGSCGRRIAILFRQWPSATG